MKNIGLILASGSGSRCGLDYPKQFAKISEKTILEISVEVFEKHESIDEIIIVTNKENVEKVSHIFKPFKKVSKVIAGGETRKDSSYNGISAINDKEANVLIHDGARPLVTPEIITSCINALNKHQAVCVTIPSTDTIFIIDEDDNITNIPKRKLIRCAQTPQCFRLSLIKQAHEKAKLDSQCLVTDDCGLIMDYTDSKIHTINGSPDNIKVTFRQDIEFVKSKLNNTKTDS